MSDLPPPPIDPGDEPTRRGDATQPEPRDSGSELPRRGYEDEPRRMRPAPPPRRSQPPPADPPAGGRRQRGTSAPPPPVSPSPPRRRPPRASKADSGLYLPWWSLVILVVVVGIGACALLFGVSELADSLVLEDQTPQVLVVTSALNSGGSQNQDNPDFVPPGDVPPSPVPIQTAVPQAAPTATIAAASAEGCPLNALVEVTGTGGDGLLIREEPRQGQNITYVANDGEQFRITEGPQNSVGVAGETIEWCRVQAEEGPATGWAAVDFLRVLFE